MLIDEPTLEPALLRLPDDPVGPNVLIPGFRSATSVRGAFGWFSAGWIERLAPGLAEYLNRTETGPIEFTVAPVVFAAERAVMEEAQSMSADEATQRVAAVFIDGHAEASALGQHALNCLAWMLATGRLRLRVAVPTPRSNYHPKIWLFDDGAHQVLVRGSGNATGRGVSEGVEHFDVDVSWQAHSRSRVEAGAAMLGDWERGKSGGLQCVVDLPEALRRNIVETAPQTAPSPSEFAMAVADDMTPSWAADSTESLRKRFALRPEPPVPRLAIPEWLQWDTGDYAHQGEAVSAWEGSGVPERGTIAMATGAGKTLTALICAARLQDRLQSRSLLVVVSAPSIPLITQWRDEVLKFGVAAVVPSLESSVDVSLTNLLRRLSSGGTHVLVVTNKMLCSPAFQATVESKWSPGRSFGTLLIADEAHRLGSDGFLSNQPEFFERRLALSATPERQYDPDGTEAVFDFFGNTVYEFGLNRAIGFCLTPYKYYVHASALGGDEFEEFLVLTSRIGALTGQGIAECDDALMSLRIARRRIVETAASKIALLRTVLEHRGPHDLKHVLVYASAKNPEQFNAIGRVLTDLDIRWAPVTKETTANKRLLAETLDTFRAGGYQVLLAKKVLDEGVDIPSISEAFIVASSTVEREWIQRRGRVLRRWPGKPWALVHDFIVLPPAQLLQGENQAAIKKFIRGELDRAYSFAAHAHNTLGESGVLADLDRIRSAYWPVGAPSAALRLEGDTLIATDLPEGPPW